MTHNFKQSLFVLAALFATNMAFSGDKNSSFTTMPPAVKAECTSCHIAYPANKMTAKNWQLVLSTLDKHYGTDATVSAIEFTIIQQYFVINASTKADKHTSQTQPPRLTTTPWFQREHRVVPREVWTNPAVKSATNCVACHTQAEKASFAEREIVVPGYEGRKW